MKTDTLITIPFIEGELLVKHKTLMVDVNDFFNLVNIYRVKNGQDVVPSRSWFSTRQAKEFIALQDKDAVKILPGRGKSKMHIKVAIRAAIDLSPQFANEVIDIFIDQRLPVMRDAGGDLYLEMNDALTLAAERVLGKSAHQGHRITLAKLIKDRCGVEVDWNNATARQHAVRIRIETALAQFLNAGVVRDWDHLKELATKV